MCGRVCTRPCEVKGCRRTMLDEAVGIDYIKRYVSRPRPEQRRRRGGPRSPRPTGRRSRWSARGPAGLSAAYYLAIKRLRGGRPRGPARAGRHAPLRHPRVPPPQGRPRPRDLADPRPRAEAVRPTPSSARTSPIASLKQQGYDAIFMGIGAWRSSLMRVQNENAAGVLSGIEFLKQFGLRRPMDISGTRGRRRRRQHRHRLRAHGAPRWASSDVKVLYRRTRTEMPANDSEIKDAIEEGVNMQFLIAPTKVVTGEDGKLEGIECQRMRAGRARRVGPEEPEADPRLRVRSSRATSSSPPSGRARRWPTWSTARSPTCCRPARRSP
ncbi:MAG: hypothetical protein MZV64_30710 [Ignavibacteriales bacterium]|nr:hypothetical protein [Ignavibacteriales bacterium]